MFPSLSDRTKTFIAASAVLLVAVCNVVFGMNWVAERPAVRPLAAVTGVKEPPPVARPPVQSPPVAAGSPPEKGNTAAAPKSGAPQPPAAPIMSQPDPAITTMNEPAAPAAAGAPPQCDIAACTAAYRTFTASDCTYMPSVGVRRLCTKGTPQPPAAPIMSQPDPAITTMNEPAAPAAAGTPPKCDIVACTAAYRTFTASDCTYMPSVGGRRMCTKGTPPQ